MGIIGNILSLGTTAATGGLAGFGLSLISKVTNGIGSSITAKREHKEKMAEWDREERILQLQAKLRSAESEDERAIAAADLEQANA